LTTKNTKDTKPSRGGRAERSNNHFPIIPVCLSLRSLRSMRLMTWFISSSFFLLSGPLVVDMIYSPLLCSSAGINTIRIISRKAAGGHRAGKYNTARRAADSVRCFFNQVKYLFDRINKINRMGEKACLWRPVNIMSANRESSGVFRQSLRMGV